MLKYHHDIDISLDTSASRILLRVRPGSRVLEFGPATGYMTRFMKEQLGCTVSCVEIDSESAAVAAAFAEQMVVSDLDDPKWVAELGDARFDHLLFADVLEHLRDPWTALGRAVGFLDPGGTLLTSIPHVGHNSVLAELLQGRFEYRKLGLMDNTHVRFFTRPSVEGLLEGAGVTPVAWLDTRAIPEHTEFATALSDVLPAPVADYLQDRPDGEVYQFITESRPPLANDEHDYPFDVTIVMPVFNKVEYTQACLEALAANTPGDMFEVVIIDNASTDGTEQLLGMLEGDVRVVRNETNVGFSAACNQGAQIARGRYLLFLNNDTVPRANWLQPLVAALDYDKRAGAAGSLLLFPDGTIQHAGVAVFDVPLEGGDPGARNIIPMHTHYKLPAVVPQANLRRDDISAVTAACVIVRRDAFSPVGGFDEEYWNGYEDIELCLRMREEGWRIVYEPASQLVHHESVSGPERFSATDANLQRLNSRWKHRIIPDHVVQPDGSIRSARHGGVEFIPE